MGAKQFIVWEKLRLEICIGGTDIILISHEYDNMISVLDALKVKVGI